IKKLFCCHVNHLLRGTESFNDEKYVEDFCKKNDISFYLLQQDINKLAKQTKTSTELCARNVRYDFFNKCVKEIALIEKIDKEKIKIATAHNLNDNIETVIFNFARGTSLKGLCGIPPKRGNIIRPLINCTRNEIENYCIENNLEFVIDSTNLEIDYSRNKIRHCISPVIFQLNNSFDKTFKNNLKNFNDENDFMNQTSKNAYDDIIENEKINF
ncbi:MAG: tRNA lysidine(34) synthetase TilS, partial [Oscillospiraceae bacterium]